MPDDDLATPAHGAGSLAIDRRTLLVGAVATVSAAGLSRARARRTRRVGGGAGPVRASTRTSRVGCRTRCTTLSAIEHPRPGSHPARTEPETRPRPASAASRRPNRYAPAIAFAPPHREDVRCRRLAATRRARPAVARRPARRGASRERHRPHRERARHHGAHAARPPRRDPGLGQPCRRRARSPVIPARCGRSQSCSTWRPRSRRRSRPERASPTPTPTTPSSP